MAMAIANALTMFPHQERSIGKVADTPVGMQHFGRRLALVEQMHHAGSDAPCRNRGTKQEQMHHA